MSCVPKHSRIFKLTPRQQSISDLIDAGLSLHMIQAYLGISRNAVDKQMQEIVEKRRLSLLADREGSKGKIITPDRAHGRLKEVDFFRIQSK